MIGARAHFCAAHKLPQHPEVHGHSYEVWAYTEEGDVEEWQNRLREALKAVDHSLLPDHLSTMEAIAQWVGYEVNAYRVVVVRPVEGLCAEWP